MFKLRVGFTTIVLLFVLAACTTKPTLYSPPEQSGSLAVHAIMPAMVEEALTLELVLKQDGQVRRHAVPQQDGRASIAVDSLHEGVWEITMQVLDVEGDVTHRASGKVHIYGRETAVTEMVLRPEPGILEVHVDLTSLHEVDRVERARLLVTPGGYTSATREDDASSLVISRSLDPQTYDYRIALYGESFLAGQLIYNSPWQPITIVPGKVTTIHWSANTGDLELVGEILPTPPQPKSFAVTEATNGTLLFTWRPGSDSGVADGFRLYERKDPFGPFAIIAEVPPDRIDWEMEVALPSEPITREYALSAFTYAGIESPRTNPVKITLPAAP